MKYAFGFSFVRRWPLWVQVNVAMLVATLSITAVTGYFVNKKELSYLASAIESEAKQVLTMLRATSIDAIISKDRPILETIVSETVKENSQIDGFYIFDAVGKPLVLWHADAREAQPVARFKQDVVVHDEKFGSIELEWNTEAKQEEIEHHIRSVQTTIILSLLLLSVVMTLVFHKLAVSPVNMIYSRLNLLAKGEYDEKISESTSKEIGRLSQSINTLSDAMAKQETDTRRQQETLERQVEERTSELNKLYEQMKHQALHDPLTGLPNRVLLVDRLSHAITRAQRYGVDTAVFFIDLNRFKHVNDSYGHLVGDQLIQETARRIRAQVRGEDTVARFAGDEFVCVLYDIKGAENAARIAQKIATAVNQPLQIEGNDLQVQASIGISLCPADSSDSETLLRHADIAMYQAKSYAHQRFEFYRDDIGEVSKRKVNLEFDLRNALRNSEMRVFYQPIRCLTSNECIAIEALLRWEHPALGMLGAGDFIGLAEEIGLIQDFDLWVLETACQQLSECNSTHGKDFMLSVNFSSKNFESPDLMAKIETIFKRLPVKPPKVQIEITENTYLQETDTIMENIAKLKQYGFRLAVDDFGAGYASFSYLARLPIDAVKIDKQFMHRLNTDRHSKTIAQAIINLGNKLGLTVIAEGVEDSIQQDFLLAQQCTTVQGFYYGRPGDINDIVSAAA